MNDIIIGVGETSQQNEALKHSFKTLKAQAKTLITKGVGGVWQQSLLHRRELRDNGTQISQVKESLFWKQKAPIENTLKSGGLVIRLARKENKSIKTYFLFEPADLGKGKNDMDLKSIVIDNPINKRESYKIDFNADGSIKITRTDGKGVETEISAEQFAYIKEIDAIKNILSTADDEVKKTAEQASVSAGKVVKAVAVLVAGAGLKPTIEYFTKLQLLQEPAVAKIEESQSEYKYDPSLVEKLKKTDSTIEKIKQVYGIEFDFVSHSYGLLKRVIGQRTTNDTWVDSLKKDEIKSFLANKRTLGEKMRLAQTPEIEIDTEAKDNNGLISLTDVDKISKFKTIIQNILGGFVQSDTGRVRKVLFASNRNHLTQEGSIMFQFGDGVYDLKTQLHETQHATTALTSAIKFNGEGVMYMNGYSSDLTIDQLNESLEVFAKNPDFYNKYFFSMTGDESLAFIKSTHNLEAGLAEIEAVSCINYFFGEKENWMGKDIKLFPEIEKMIKRQLAVTVFGESYLRNNPDGITYEDITKVRSLVGKQYINGLLGLITDENLKQKLSDAINGDISPYFSKNEDEYFSDKNIPEEEENKRLIFNGMNMSNYYEIFLSKPNNIEDYVFIWEINEFIARYGRTFFPDGKIG